MPTIPKTQIPQYVRQCYEQWQKATLRNREAEKERLRFYVGGDLQWRDEELAERRLKNRPWITINRCKPAVDQIEGDVRLNPPGPSTAPVGDHGEDHADPDIIDGLIRECEYRSHATVAYSTAARYSAASGCAYIELETEYAGERSWQQRLVIKPVEDPSTVFIDPTARMAHRQDAGWGGKLKMYSKSEYIAKFGANRAVLKSTLAQRTGGWIQDAIGYEGNLRQVSEWTGKGDGPFFVAEFYMVTGDTIKLYDCSDGVSRFEDEPMPSGVTILDQRPEFRREIKKFVCDALENLDETDWLGNLIPLFPVLGQEIWIDGRLHRLSLISGAIDSNRAHNYVATTMTEVAGLMPKSPWIGYKGQFDDPRWKNANSEVYAYLEVTPTFATDETTGGQTLLPPPQRNQWEAGIQWLLALGAFFSDAIKATTSIFDPSLGQVKGDQSGKAIEQLRSESNVGNFSYADNLHRAIEVMYGEMVNIFPKIMDSQMAATIIRADGQPEQAEINRVFQKDTPRPDGKEGKANNITLGMYSTRVMSGPNADTRQKEAVRVMLDFFKVNPQALGAPGIAAKLLRMIGQGNPEVEGMADLLSPDVDGANPAQLGQQLQQEQAKNQQLTIIAQKLQQALQSKTPELEVKKYIAQLDNLTKIRVAEISASKDADRQAAELEAEHLGDALGFAHDAGMQATEHEHASQQAELAAQQAQQQQEQEAKTEETDNGG